MKMLKKSVFLLLAAATVASCSKSELEAPASEGADIVLRSSFTKIDASTRAPFVGELSEENPFTALVLGSINAGNYTSLHANGTMTFKGGTDGVAYNRPMNGGTSAIFPGTNPVHLVGLYPTDFVVGSGTATLSLTGKEDVMFAPEVSTTKAEVQNLEFATLAFEHQLTKLEVRVRAGGPDAIAAFGTIKDIKLTAANGAAINTGASIALATGVVTLGTPISVAYNWYNMSVDADDVVSYADVAYNANHQLTNETTYVAYTLVAPVTASSAANANEYTLQVTYNKGDGSADVAATPTQIDLKDVDGNPFTGSTKGYSFLITLNFDKGEINASATVQDWYEGGESIVVIE